MLARAAGLVVTAHHVDHGHRLGTDTDAERAAEIAASVGVPFRLYRAELDPGPNFEAAARSERRRLLGSGMMTGHTADDLAETVLYRLLRGTGPDGLAAMRPGPAHPVLRLRRSDTEEICAVAGIVPIEDPTNSDPRYVRNRIRHELLPLASEILDRDVVPLLVRTATLATAQRDLIEQLAAEIDPTDARSLTSLPEPVAAAAIRDWVAAAHPERYVPDLASVQRVLAVARGETIACELTGGLRVERTNQRLRITGTRTRQQR